MIVTFPTKPFVGEFQPDEVVPIMIGFRELYLLADEIEREAREHDRQRGSCPRDLWIQERRADELRRLAERYARAGGAA